METLDVFTYKPNYSKETQYNCIDNNENDINSIIVIIKRGSSLKASQFFYPPGSHDDYIMLLSIFPVESSFPCEHGTHEYAGCNRFSVFQVREIFCNTTF